MATSAARLVRAPRGTELSCKGWPQEAALRMLMNNLDPEVAEHPEDLVVYGGTGRAVRNWEAFDAIVRTLRGLAADETMLVQSGKPVGVFRTHEWAPRVLIANSNLVGDWANWGQFRKLEAEGLFAPERKRPLPALPQRLGLVTSATGAAVRDVLKVLSRWQHCSVLLYPVRVQGKGAEGEIARAIRYLARSGLVDVVLVVRGGGSLEDLWSFNEEIVARAIAASAVPVVTGVGHEIDFTMADFVADVRAATPTQAAELVIARLEEQLRRTEDAGQRVRAAFTRLRERSRMRLESLAGARGLAWLPARLAELHQRLLRLEALPQRLRAKVTARHRKLDSAATKLFHWPVRFGAPRRRELLAARMAVAAERLRSILRRRALELAGQERALEALSPRRVLRRGFSITQREGSSAPLTDPREVVPGEHIVTTLAQGTLRSLVQGARGMQADLFEDDDVAPGVRDRQETKGT